MDAQLDRRGVAEVDHPALVERAAVVDPHHHRLAVVQVGDAGEAGQRQGLVRGGEGVHVVHLHVRGAAAVELGAVVGGDALLDVAVRAVQHLVLLAQHRVRRAVADRRARLVGHHRLGDAVDVGQVVGEPVRHPGLVQPTGRVVAAGGRVLLRRRVVDPGAIAGRRGARGRAAGPARGRGRRLLRRAAAGGQRKRGQHHGGAQPQGPGPAPGHAGGISRPAIASDSWNTAIAYILEML
ncbi:hypothetical protein L613_000100000540 [Pseudoxanthomonas taiwanensis J19]|uniref:Uncharacterized protein n=1 Tax=Pseudoxanthomonas taiwanensis J19 TaxID=935569 RepID=A0A562E7S5_9GAMM|nr:hypothetical protein L613_000100000540 [Pseudoxanthomonas taiwanensis J19]